MGGILYLVATPIGNLEDITFRAIRILKEADYIAAEDTRHTKKLLNHFEIKKPMESYHEHNKVVKGEKIIQDLKSGLNIALVTDAGTPGISDPGEDLVKLCIENNILVTSIPGAAAFVNGLIISGKQTRRFVFEGFLPFQKKERKQVLEMILKETRTIIFYEAPHKLKSTLEDLYKAVGNREITIARELTKKFEELIHTNLENALEYYKINEPRGEYVLILSGADREIIEKEQIDTWLEKSPEEHLQYYSNKGLSKNEAIKQIAKDRGISRKEAYNFFTN